MADDDLKVVFNFYEKITPPPKFTTFTEGWQHLGNYIETLDHYMGSQLHKNLHAKGIYPYVNFATFKGSKERILKDMTDPTPDLVKALVEGHGIPGHQVNHPGAYVELATNNNQPLAPDFPPKLQSTFILMGFQTAQGDGGVVDYFEGDWDNHVGLTDIKEYLQSCGKELGRYGIYKRFTPYAPFQSMAYVFRCELIDVDREDSNLLELIDKIQKSTTPEGVTREDTSLYFIEHVSPK